VVVAGADARAAIAAEQSAAVPAPWKPDMRAATRYARGRVGQIAFAVRTPTRGWRWHGDRQFHSASVLKAMLLVAYLRKTGVRHRSLHKAERDLLRPMIQRSANKPANRLMGIVGTGGLMRLARRARMRHFVPVAGIWGASRITARDQARFFLRIDHFIPAHHREYALHLLETIVPSQRWGIARVQPPGWNLYFKGGWGSGSGAVDNQVALLKRGGQRVSVAILTQNNGSHKYGRETLRGVALRLLRGLPSGVVVP
jgi:hypothetical protein